MWVDVVVWRVAMDIAEVEIIASFFFRLCLCWDAAAEAQRSTTAVFP